MLLNLSKPLQTREGKPVTIFQTDGRGKTPIGGWIGEGATRYYWTAAGIHSDPSKNLENVPEKPKQVTYWYNFYQHPNGDIDSTGPWDSHPKAVADTVGYASAPNVEFICRKKVIVEKGKFDE